MSGSEWHPRRFTRAEVAYTLGISEDTVRRRAEKGELRMLKLGRRTWYQLPPELVPTVDPTDASLRASIERLLAALEVEQATAREALDIARTLSSQVGIAGILARHVESLTARLDQLAATEPRVWRVAEEPEDSPRPPDEPPALPPRRRPRKRT